MKTLWKRKKRRRKSDSPKGKCVDCDFLEACNCIVKKKRVGGHLLSATSNLSVSGPSPGVQGADFSLKRPFWHGDSKRGGTLYFFPLIGSVLRYVVNMPSEELKERNKRAL